MLGLLLASTGWRRRSLITTAIWKDRGLARAALMVVHHQPLESPDCGGAFGGVGRFDVHVMQLDDEGSDLVAIVWELGTAMGALRNGSHRSARESAIVSVRETAPGQRAVRACKGCCVATTSGTSPVAIEHRPTHGTRTVGADSRVQRVARIA